MIPQSELTRINRLADVAMEMYKHFATSKQTFKAGYVAGATVEYENCQKALASTAVHWHYFRKKLEEIAAGQPNKWLPRLIAQQVLDNEFTQDGVNTMREILQRQEMVRAIGFEQWVREKKYLQDAEGYWYEPSTYRYQGEHGMCVAISSEDLFEKYLETITLKP